MAFSPRNLSVLAYANGFTLWLYKTRDRLCDVDDGRYFDAAADLLAGGDMVMGHGGRRGPAGSGRGGIGRLPPVAGELTLGRSDLSALEDFACVPGASGLGDRVAPVWPLCREAQAGQTMQAGAVLQPVGSADLLDQHQPVQRRAAAGLEIRFVPHGGQSGPTRSGFPLGGTAGISPRP